MAKLKREFETPVEATREMSYYTLMYLIELNDKFDKLIKVLTPESEKKEVKKVDKTRNTNKGKQAT